METQSMEFKSIKCSDDCCTFLVSQYKKIEWLDGDGWKQTAQKIKKSGCFIYDPESNKILLIQSRGQLWGPPKGSIQENEDMISCAVREVKEETGIDVKESEFCETIILKGTSVYYVLKLSEQYVYPQTHISGNDANSIGWIKLDCLKKMIDQDKMRLTQHCKLLIKKLFNIF